MTGENGLPRRLRRLAMTRGYGVPGEAQRSGFAGVKEEGGSIAPFSPEAETERCELLLTPSL